MATQLTYGIGGYDPTKPNNNVIEEVVVPDPPPPVRTAEDKLAAVSAALDNVTDPVLVTDVVDIIREAIV